jgi:hypothetical protein
VFVHFLLLRQLWFSGCGVDESAHLMAGLYHLETLEMDAYRVNPPLPRMIAALPLLVDHPIIEWNRAIASSQRIEFEFGKRWLVDNSSETVRRQLRASRLMLLGFFYLGAWIVYRWAEMLYGRGSAYIALSMWCLSPDVLTNSALVGPDTAAAATGMLTCFVFWRWITKDALGLPWSVGLCVGIAILCKFTWLLLLVILPIVTFIHSMGHRSIPRHSRLWQATARTVLICSSFTASLLIVNLFYGFDQTGMPLREYQFRSQQLANTKQVASGSGNRFREHWIGAIPVPVPKEMLLGVDYLAWQFESGSPSYLRGKWQDHGWWYFYVYAFAIKTPLGFLFLLGLSFLSWCKCTVLYRTSVGGEWFPPLVAGLIFLMVSTQTGFTHHVRYVLPAYGFLFIFSSRVIGRMGPKIRYCLTIITLSDIMYFHVTHAGVSHTFFNQLVGGPRTGWRHLSFDNVDSGQSSYRIHQWLEDHPRARPITVLASN